MASLFFFLDLSMFELFSWWGFNVQSKVLEDALSGAALLPAPLKLPWLTIHPILNKAHWQEVIQPDFL